MKTNLIKCSFLVFFFAFQSFSFELHSQSNDEILLIFNKVNSLDQVDSLRIEYPNLDISVSTFLVSDSLLFPEIISAEIGQVIQKKKLPILPMSNYKIFGIQDEEVCKVKYIYLSGKTYDPSQVDSLREIIINKYKAGEDFTTLVEEYTMDNNLTGEISWFYEGMMVKEFDDGVRKRKKGEIFTVDVKEQNWYYVVLKTHENKFVKAIKAIEIRSGM